MVGLFIWFWLVMAYKRLLNLRLHAVVKAVGNKEYYTPVAVLFLITATSRRTKSI